MTEALSLSDAIKRIKCTPKALEDLTQDFAMKNRNLRQQTILEANIIKKCIEKRKRTSKKGKGENQPSEAGQRYSKCYAEQKAELLKGTTRKLTLEERQATFAICSKARSKGDTNGKKETDEKTD